VADRPWLRLTRRENEQRIAAARVVAAQRRGPDLSLKAAAAREGLTPAAVLRYFGRWYARDPTGSLEPLPSDREPFLMNVYSTRGIVEVEIPDSDSRSLIGQHTSAVWRYRDTGDTSGLDLFRRRRVAGVTLETDPDRLLRLLLTGPDFLEIYSI
jgi:hypothetical protein